MEDIQIKNVKPSASKKLDMICKQLDISKTFMLKKYMMRTPKTHRIEIELESTRVEIYGLSNECVENINLYCKKNRISRDLYGRNTINEIIRDFEHLL